jgi:hypothetical protein
MLELCVCPECGLVAEVVSDVGPAVTVMPDVSGPSARTSVDQLVGVRCIGRHWFFGLRGRLVA